MDKLDCHEVHRAPADNRQAQMGHAPVGTCCVLESTCVSLHEHLFCVRVFMNTCLHEHLSCVRVFMNRESYARFAVEEYDEHTGDAGKVKAPGIRARDGCEKSDDSSDVDDTSSDDDDGDGDASGVDKNAAKKARMKMKFSSNKGAIPCLASCSAKHAMLLVFEKFSEPAGA